MLRTMTQMPVNSASWSGSADTTPWWWHRANWLYGALLNGSLADHGGAEPAKYPVEFRELGSLDFSGGELVIGDPYLMWDDTRPIVQWLLPQAYDVVTARAVVGLEHRRNAAAMLVGAPDAITSWDIARWSDQDPGSLGEEEMYGYGVDAGTGCFASAEAAPTMMRVLSEDAGMLEDPLSQIFESGTSGGGGVRAPEEGADLVAVFESGWGDGFYPTWLGRNSAGEIVLVLTDFMLTGDPYGSRP